MPINVLIADDHPMVLEGIKNSLANSSTINVVATVNNGQKVLDFIKHKSVDIILLDIDMPILNGLDCTKMILEDYPNQKVVILSMHQDKYVIKKAVDIGAKAYLIKTIDHKELVFALEKINSGESYFNADVTQVLLSKEKITTPKTSLQNAHLVDELTKREKEIIKLICSGLNNSQVGEKLFISSKTVDTHRTNIMRKLDIHNVVGLVKFAFQHNLI